MTDLSNIRRQNLSDLVNKHGLSEVARRVNKPASQISDMLSGRKSFGEKVARAIEQAWGGQLPPMWLDQQDGGQPISEMRKVELPAEKGNVLVWENPEDLPEDTGRVWIDRYDYRFSAGAGTIQWEVRQKRALPFDGSFFQKIGSRPQDCKLCIVRGDSMEPYLFNRDMMMVDSAKTNVRDGRIYAVLFEDEALVKQVFKQVGGGLVLHSYNSSKYPDKEVPADKLEYLRIAGEIVYRSGSGPAGGN
ncbi:S24 family peptidase [Pandoraea apista]|uniref:S24 family peptidase n=1 Tax=Pandoraea apista TaxID=93218 RepID=UPI00065E2C06|nr:S24 family peptidase [Pandoraea apista]ALS64906.1 repressor [Pandoraea apista]